MGFKENNPYNKRIYESGKIMMKYPERTPCIIEKKEGSDIPSVDKNKYLVPSDLTMGQLLYVIRKRIQLSPEKAIFVLVGDKIPCSTSSVSQVYGENKDEDGFLYIVYSGENTFGRNII
jgi:GABA(A) receptor-associated protein